MPLSIPEIYTGEGDIPEGMNGRLLSLDMSLSSSLDFRGVFARACELTSQGFSIFWHLDFGFFDNPPNSKLQQSARQLAIDYFLEAEPEGIGACVYLGSPPSEALCNLLEQLCAPLPDTLPPYFLLSSDPEPGFFSSIKAAIQNSCYPYYDLGWETPSAFGYLARKKLPLSDAKPPKIAICWPAEPERQKKLKTLNRFDVRYIPEEHIISEWEGLDTLIINGEGISDSTRRALMGFEAAGGTVKIV